MPITVADLKEQTGVPGPHPILYCGECGAESSANSSDYFLVRKTHVFRHCRKPMRLVLKSVVYQPVDQDEED